MFNKTTLITIPPEIEEATGIKGTFQIKRLSGDETAELLKYSKDLIKDEGDNEYGEYMTSLKYVELGTISCPVEGCSVRDLDWEVSKWLMEEIQKFNSPLAQSSSCVSNGHSDTEHKTLI